MKKIAQQIIACLLFTLLLLSCKKDQESSSSNSMNNTSWQAAITITGNSSSQNIFEFGNGNSFSWHPAAAASYTGTWLQQGGSVSFSFKETTASGDYYWDNTGVLSNNNTLLTGTMQRRGTTGSGTFTARKL